jgi:hypothetical protein
VVGKAALIASVGGRRGFADWTNPDHRLRRLLSEFIGMAGMTFVLSGGAAILARYGGRGLQPWETVLVLSLVSALWDGLFRTGADYDLQRFGLANRCCRYLSMNNTPVGRRSPVLLVAHPGEPSSNS